MEYHTGSEFTLMAMELFIKDFLIKEKSTERGMLKCPMDIVM